MSLARYLALLRLEARVLRRDPGVFILLIVTPAVLALLVQPLLRLAASSIGETGTTGTLRAVAGMAVLFAFFVQGFEALAFYRDHGWRVWDRVRCSGASPLELVLGKITIYLLLSVAQMIVLLAIGLAVFDVAVPDTLVPIAIVLVSWSAFVVSMGLALVTLCSTIDRFMAISNLSAITLAGLGGAIVPMKLLPSWVQPWSEFIPTHSAMQGLLLAFGPDPSLGSVLLPAGTLIGFAGAAAALAAIRFSVEDAKGAWSA